MLIYFAVDGESSVTIYGGSQTAEAFHDFCLTLKPGERFGNLRFRQLQDAQRGTILWDAANRRGEILMPDDPRWNQLFPQG